VKLFEEMQSAGIRANAVTYNTLISVHVKAEDYPAAAAMMQLMRQSGERPSEFTLNAMITAYAKLGQADEALEVYSKSVACCAIVPCFLFCLLCDSGFGKFLLGAIVRAYTKLGRLDEGLSAYCKQYWSCVL
jgi:pentatricopeptide repeat protein